MRRSVTILAAGAAALTLALPASAAFAAAARPATAHQARLPKTGKSRYGAGYAQAGCGHRGYPQYLQVLGTITVPAATDASGMPGNSTDYYTIGPRRRAGHGLDHGVAAGVAVLTDAGQSFIYAYGQWYGQPLARASFTVQPGDKLAVQIENEGSGNWKVDITDQATQQEWTQTSPDSAMPENACSVGAYESSSYPVYDVLTQTTPVAFRFSRVLWGERGQAVASVSKLLSPAPRHAHRARYSLIGPAGHTKAVTSGPRDHSNNFTVTDR